MNERAREIQAAVYLLAGCSLAGLIVLRMLLIFYGVALHTLFFLSHWLQRWLWLALVWSA